MKGEHFKNCYYLYSNKVEEEQVKEIEILNSIDNLEWILAKWIHPSVKYYYGWRDVDYEITPEEQFWAHCSNLQVWAENNYNTCLLNMDTAFPLLEKLFKIGDPNAKNVFKKEICKRFLSGGYIVKYLLTNNFLKNLNNEELDNLFNKFDFKYFNQMDSKTLIPFLKFIVDIKNQICMNFFKSKVFEIINSSKENVKLYTFLLAKDYIYCFNKEEINSLVQNFKTEPLTKITLAGLHLNYLPKTLFELKTIENLNLRANNLKTLPMEIENLSSLKTLNLVGGSLENLPESIGNLKSLQNLYLNFNPFLKSLPESIGNLKALKKLLIFCGGVVNPLSIDGNLNTLPESIGNLGSLETFILRVNRMNILPDSIGKLKSLKRLDLSYNNLTYLPETFGNLISLEELDLGFNELKFLPKSFGNLISLKCLDLRNNKLETLPKSIINLPMLKSINLSQNPLLKNSDPKLKEILNHLNSVGVKIDNNVFSITGLFYCDDEYLI